eukprot:TRINITY_DN66549_c0_g1_i1.p1 TRINITY_DN66549_c0_g1~~TRINITY_DN66549_c0_g1_i1.p1  ORF type:complete len:503 (-),score=71.80 TRINITY_DN66549_c0_g1_i1:45-1553(-)
MAKPLEGDDKFTRPMSMETTCVTIAKGRQKLRDIMAKNIQVDGKFWDGGAYALQSHLRRDYKMHLCNGLVCFSAGEGEVDKAERWMNVLDHGVGLIPEMKTYNALLSGLSERGMFEKADEWFERPHQAALHPELGDLRPDAQSYDIMIRSTSKANDLIRAERYFHQSMTRGFRPHRESFFEIVRAMLRNDEPKRAHVWLEELVVRGCRQTANYSSEELKDQLVSLHSMRSWNPDVLVKLINDLATSLARIGNTVTADRWLGYLVEAGLKAEDLPETWNIVRASSPKRIMPARLYAESPPRERCKPEAAKLFPAILSGEKAPPASAWSSVDPQALALTMGADDGGNTARRPSTSFSKAETIEEPSRPRSVAGNRPRSQADTKRPASQAGNRPVSQVSTRAGSSMAYTSRAGTALAINAMSSEPTGEPGPRPASRRELISNGLLMSPKSGQERSPDTSAAKALHRLLQAKKLSHQVAQTSAARRLGAQTARGERGTKSLLNEPL